MIENLSFYIKHITKFLVLKYFIHCWLIQFRIKISLVK